ncbi:MFS transporter [Virgibacillus byunsanensis]|uniref:MFS transporter n=1 Tax=Virgibacillus byunsanensis TaxID=570945 RepID=A0ABW3LHN7_9BACI
MWFANFFIAGSITMVLPFISLYIETFGNFSDSYVQSWSGWIFGITFVTAFLFSPLWGRIGDKYGRKKILIISAFGLGLSVFLMGFATSVWQLFLLRLLMGIFTGFIPMSQALISTQTPRKIAGKVLGTLQTGSVTGTLMGPLLGGALADVFGYATTFKWVSITIFLSALIVIFGIKEVLMKFSDDKDHQEYSSKEVILHIVKNPVLLMVMLISMLVQVAHFSIQPILSLFVAEIHGPASIALFSGMAFSAAGLGNLMMARKWGQLGDKFGYIKILIFLLFMAGIVYFPGGFVTNIWQLLILRFLLGMSIGGIIPVRVAYIRQEAPLSMQGEVLGYNTSLRFLGNIIGPALGGMLAGFFGFSAVFMVTSVLLIICGVILLGTWYKHEYEGRTSRTLSSTKG